MSPPVDFVIFLLFQFHLILIILFCKELNFW